MRESSIERLVGARGVSEQDKRAFVEDTGRELFEAAKTLEVAGEVPKTPEQIELCKIINAQTAEIVQQYGGQDLNITPDHVRITDDPHVIMEEGDAQFAPDKQLALLRPSDNDLVFAYKTVHEFFHFKSYGAMQIPLSEEMATDMYYRVGLRINNRKGDGDFFNALEEAVNETLTKRLIEKLKSEVTSFKKIVEDTDKAEKSMDLDEKLRSDLVYLGRDGVGHKYTYPKERESLDILLDKINAKNPNKFESTEQIFEVFAQAKFTGNILPLARLIDGTFGNGTFRKIGEAHHGDHLLYVVKSL